MSKKNGCAELFGLLVVIVIILINVYMACRYMESYHKKKHPAWSVLIVPEEDTAQGLYRVEHRIKGEQGPEYFWCQDRANLLKVIDELTLQHYPPPPDHFRGGRKKGK